LAAAEIAATPKPKGRHMRFSNLVRTIFLGATLALVSAASFAGVFVSVSIAPPVLPVYTQPLCPGDGYLWTPGYWAYGQEGYYWVPGVWVQPPTVGLLWTPAYWGWSGGAYLFHAGYWGPHVGFYGGVNYGFGYTGVGFVGGRWEGERFAYNTAVLNVNRVVVRNVYEDRTVIRTGPYVRTSFNGGVEGIQVRASEREMAFEHERRFDATPEQRNHMEMAHADRSNFASVNGGHPQNAAFSRPGVRAENQQQRIGQGVHSGEMTAGETRNVEGREASINHQVAADRAANGGHLTAQEHQQVNQRQSNVSRSINQDKHNANTQAHPHAESREPKK
jgi:hypothetical protein